MPNMILLILICPRSTDSKYCAGSALTNGPKRLPVVILTTSTEDNDLMSGYDLGANSYVRKPVDFEQFVEAVRQLGLYWLSVNERPPLPEGT